MAWMQNKKLYDKVVAKFQRSNHRGKKGKMNITNYNYERKLEKCIIGGLLLHK